MQLPALVVVSPIKFPPGHWSLGAREKSFEFLQHFFSSFANLAVLVSRREGARDGRTLVGERSCQPDSGAHSFLGDLVGRTAAPNV